MVCAVRPGTILVLFVIRSWVIFTALTVFLVNIHTNVINIAFNILT